MKSILLFACMLMSAVAWSQTYSKLLEPYDLRENIMMDMEVANDTIYLATRHLCDPDTSDNSIISCTSVSLYNQAGELLTSVLVDTLHPEGFNRLLVDHEKVFLSGHHHESFYGRSVVLYQFNSDCSVLDSIYAFTNNADELANNNGLLATDNGYILYGNKIKDNNQSVDIRSFSLALEEKQELSTARVPFDNDCNDLQLTAEGNLIYANPYNDGPGAGPESGQQIILLDTSLNKLDSLEFSSFIEDSSGKLRLLPSTTGHIYLMTNRHPEGSIVPSQGHINKYSANLDTLVWSVKLPVNDLINGRQYRIHDFYEAQNGDILASGRAFDTSPNTLLDQTNKGWSGFLVRLSPAGEIKFLRVYKVPHSRQDILPPSDYSIYHETSLWNIHELEDGRILLGGTVTYSSLQLGSILQNDQMRSFGWLMTVDAMGCLDGEECQEVIVIDGTANKSQAIFPVGTKWTYEYLPDPIDPSTIEYSYITYEVTDTVSQNDTTVYTIQNNRGLPTERMIQGDNEVWFWDNGLSDWQLTYDFDAINSYPTQYGNPDFLTNTTVDIDTIELFTFGARSVVDLQKVSIVDNGTLEEPLSLCILNRCGSLDGGLRLGIGQNLFDPFYQIGKLRCFEQDTFFYNFSTFDNPVIPCDSTWIDIIDNVDELAAEGLSVYPNPTTGLLHIAANTPITSVQIYSTTGALVQTASSLQGLSVEVDISALPAGVYPILVHTENGTRYQKISKL